MWVPMLLITNYGDKTSNIIFIFIQFNLCLIQFLLFNILAYI